MPALSSPIPEPAPLRVLPFHGDAFDWRRFETFCLDVVRALSDVRHAEVYGVPGGSQRGIDIVATLDDGRRRTIQCRHRKRFTKGDADKVVEETTYDAEEHEVWVTTRVGAAAAGVLDEHDGWSYQSDEGISQLVRSLPTEVARKIVDHAFGRAVRSAFLGGGMIAFDGPEAYFAPFDQPGRLIRHDLRLVGRGDELEALRAAVDGPGFRVVVQAGRGGIGKTRLLRALASELEAGGVRVLFARPGVELSAEAVDELPLEPVVVVVDDAHRPDVGLSALLAEASRRPDLTVVLGVRPAGRDAVLATAANAGLEPNQVAVLPPLGPLGHEAVETLAESAAGQADEQTRRLADATRESPLITVIGGSLLARGQLGPATDEELRRSVLARFSAEQLGRVTPRLPEAQARALATLVAALQPLNADDDELLAIVGEELDVPISQVRRWLGELEAAGLLLARGRLRRLTPDVLADELLLEACVDAAGRPTGYADDLWARYAGSSAANLLSNLSELDWRPLARGTSLLDAVWANVEERFARADAWGREQLLELIVRAAFFVPARALRIVRRALADPARTTHWSGVDLTIDDTSVRTKLPAALRAVAQYPAHAREALGLLWALGRDDARPMNAHPDHPVRVIGEVAGYRTGRAAHHDALLDLVEHELAQPGGDAHHHLPLELVEPLLAREGTTTRARGSTIQMGSYTVNAEATRRWRERISGLLVDRGLNGSPRERIAAAKLLQDALALPHGYFGNPVAPEARDSWHDDQLALLEAIGEIEARSDDAAVRDALGRGLRWHAEHDPWPDVRATADALLGRLAGPDEELVAAIAHQWDLLDQQAIHDRNARVATRLLGRYPEPAQLADALNGLVADLAERGQNAVVGPVLARVCRESHAHARGIWAWAREHSNAALAAQASVALDELRRGGESVAELLIEGWASGEPPIRRAITSYLASGAWFGDPEDAEVGLLEACVGDDDPLVRDTTRVALLRLRQVDGALASRLAVRLPAAGGHHGDIVFATLHEQGIATLGDEELDRLVDQLVAVPELEYFGCKVVADLAATDLERWLAVWQRRLEHDRDAGDDRARYRAVPTRDHDADLLCDVAPDDRRMAFERLLALAPSLDAWGTRQLGTLYWRAGIPDADDLADEPPELDAVRGAEALEVFAARATVDQIDGNTVVNLLFELPWQVVLEQPSWVRRLLNATEGKRREDIMGGIHAAAFGGVFRSTRIARIAQAAAKIAASEPPGSSVGDLYEALERAALRHQEQERRDDEELDAGWG
jgi:hypothetical protein